MPRHRNRNNQIHFDAGFKACQIASQKIIKTKDERIKKLENDISNLDAAIGDLQYKLKISHSSLIQTENIMSQYGEKIRIIEMLIHLPISTVSYEQVNGKSNDNDRSSTRNNC